MSIHANSVSPPPRPAGGRAPPASSPPCSTGVRPPQAPADPSLHRRPARACGQGLCSSPHESELQGLIAQRSSGAGAPGRSSRCMGDCPWDPAVGGCAAHGSELEAPHCRWPPRVRAPSASPPPRAAGGSISLCVVASVRGRGRSPSASLPPHAARGRALLHTAKAARRAILPPPIPLAPDRP